MAGLMQWFQVTCPSCTAALQVRLPEGVTSVQCSQCKAVFAVQVQPVALSTAGQQAPTKRSRKRKAGADKSASTNGTAAEPPRTLSAYNVFMKGEVAKVKAEHPDLPHREAFKLAAERWQSSPMNPQNGGERFPLKRSTTPELPGFADGVAAGASAAEAGEGGDQAASSSMAAEHGQASTATATGEGDGGAGDGDDGEEEDDEEEDDVDDGDDA